MGARLLTGIASSMWKECVYAQPSAHPATFALKMLVAIILGMMMMATLGTMLTMMMVMMTMMHGAASSL